MKCYEYGPWSLGSKWSSWLLGLTGMTDYRIQSYKSIFVVI